MPLHNKSVAQKSFVTKLFSTETFVWLDERLYKALDAIFRSSIKNVSLIIKGFEKGGAPPERRRRREDAGGVKLKIL